MADYKTMYTNLFNAVTDAIGILQKAQIKSEEQFINHEEANIIKLKNPEDSE